MKTSAIANNFETSDMAIHEMEMSYIRPMGGYKPKFAGKPQGYFPASACDIILMVSLVLFISLGTLGMMIGFLYWEFASGIKSFVDVWVIVMCVFVGLMFIGIYFGGRAKITQERRMIQEKLATLKRELEQEKLIEK